MDFESEDEQFCDFCGRPADEAGPLIEGIDEVFICKNCADACFHLFDVSEKEALDIVINEEEKNIDNAIRIFPPKEIKAFLDQYVIGQEYAKKILSVAVYNHYKRLKYNFKDNDVELDKSNVCLIGPTGSGKTLLARTLAKILNVPFAITDATSITEAGYVGEDVENVLVRLLQTADYDVEKTQRGIVFIDEIDKIAKRNAGTSITKDVGGEGVQQSLLKIIEGSIVNVPPQGGRKHPDQRMIQIDTTNILFIVGGAFEGIEKIISQRATKTAMGFGSNIESKKTNDYNDLILDITSEDLMTFGLIPEFVGRLPVITALKQLDEEALKSILLEPKNSIIKQYSKLFELDGITLDFDKSAVDAIVKKAIKRKTGVRGLKGEIENILTEAMFEIPGNDEITKVKIVSAFKDSQSTCELKYYAKNKKVSIK